MKLKNKTKQKGIFVADAMIGLIIFTIGVLGILKYQGDTITATSQAQYRVAASFLAESLINSMWLERNKVPTYTSNNVNYDDWLAQVNSNLPGSIDNAPVINITDDGTGVYEVAIEIKWRNQAGNISSHKLTSTIY